MIVQGGITPELRSQSQRNYNIFSLLNGVSYICVGETIIILFAVELNMPNTYVSAIGAMLYLAFLMLPLGKVVAARVGGAETQAVFWILRNLAGLLVAASAPLMLMGYPVLAAMVLLSGAFFFYGFRAGGVAMAQPLLAEWTTPSDRARVIANSNGLFYFANIVILLLILLFLKYLPGLWSLAVIILSGSVVGIFSSRFIRRICETPALRESARKPLRHLFPRLLRERLYRRMLANSFAFNLVIIMVLPISMLALKRGYNVPDATALLFSVAQFAGASLFSFVGTFLLRRFPLRSVMVASYSTMLGIAFLWIVAPRTIHVPFTAVLFFVLGCAFILGANAVTHYFISNVRPEHQVAFSVLNALLSGAGAGLCGMILAAGVMGRIAAFWPQYEDTITGFRWYFAVVVLLLLPGLIFPLRLPDHARGIR